MRGHANAVSVLIGLTILGGSHWIAEAAGQTDVPSTSSRWGIEERTAGESFGEPMTLKGNVVHTPNPSFFEHRLHFPFETKREGMMNDKQLLAFSISRKEQDPLLAEHPLHQGHAITSSLVIRALEDDKWRKTSTSDKLVDDDDFAVLGGVQLKF